MQGDAEVEREIRHQVVVRLAIACKRNVAKFIAFTFPNGVCL